MIQKAANKIIILTLFLVTVYASILTGYVYGSLNPVLPLAEAMPHE